MSTIPMYPEQVNSAWQSGATTSSLRDILLNGLSRGIDGAIAQKFAPKDPVVFGSNRGGSGEYTAGQTAGLMASPNAGLLLIGGAVLLLFLILK